jgi:hypothetical protein
MQQRLLRTIACIDGLLWAIVVEWRQRQSLVEENKKLRTWPQQPTENHSDLATKKPTKNHSASMASFRRSASNGDGGNQVRNEMNIFCITLTNIEKNTLKYHAYPFSINRLCRLHGKIFPATTAIEQMRSPDTPHFYIAHQLKDKSVLRVRILFWSIAFPGQLYVHVGVNFFFFTQHIHILIILCH